MHHWQKKPFAYTLLKRSFAENLQDIFRKSNFARATFHIEHIEGHQYRSSFLNTFTILLRLIV